MPSSMDYQANYPCDMHAHTTNSDGNDTYPELIDAAVRAGVRVLAVADHDVLPILEIDGRSTVRDALSRGLVLLPGCEFSCETYIEDCHIKIIGGDWSNADIRKIIDEIAASKSNSYLELLEILRSRNMPIDLDELLEFGNPIQVEDLQKKRIFEFMAHKGYTKDWTSAKLLVRNDPELAVKRKKPSAFSVIRAARASGGVVSLAHPYLMDAHVEFDGQTISRAEWIDRMIAEGLQGIEASYTYDKTTTSEPMSKQEMEDAIRRDYAGRLFIDGGSDYHADHKKGIEHPRYLGECGLHREEFMQTPYAALLTPEQLAVFDEPEN